MKRLIYAAILFCAPASAKWWIETDEMTVKADLQLLSDYRLVTQPLNTYPLMWAAIIKELQSLKPEQLNTEQNAALQRLLASWQQDQNTSLNYQLNAASSENRFYSFGDHYRDKASAQLSYQFSNTPVRWPVLV